MTAAIQAPGGVAQGGSAEGAPTPTAWMQIEHFGHIRVAGWVTEVEIAGRKFLAVDVPETENNHAYRLYVNPGSVFRMTPMPQGSVISLLEDPWDTSYASFAAKAKPAAPPTIGPGDDDDLPL